MESPLPAPHPPAPTNLRKVPNACQRCRRQKLKCDVHRPCTLCVRVGADCLSAEKPIIWKNQGPDLHSNKTRKANTTSARPAAKRARREASPADEASGFVSSGNGVTTDGSFSNKPVTAVSPEPSASPVTGGDGAGNGPATHPVVNRPWSSSSAAIKFAEEAFHQHDTTTSEETSAFSASQWMCEDTLGTSEPETVRPESHRRIGMFGGAPARVMGRRGPSSAEADLVSLLPQLEVAAIIVDNYFNRIHWFMLVFHQSDFRDSIGQLYAPFDPSIARSSPRLGCLSVFAAVCVVSLQHMNAEQNASLVRLGVQPELLQQRLLQTLRLRILDVVSLGSLEAVQTCVLLGSFYLYHGNPELAWPICGNGLRIAQALNLHRKRPSDGPHTPDLDNAAERVEETRKRCWWAVYEIETFCCMLYGFPLSINDDDCDIGLLNPYPKRSRDGSWAGRAWKMSGQATLLSYKFAMVQLSIIVKSALTDLYGLRESILDKDSSPVGDGTRLQDLISNVARLDRRIRSWFLELPDQLKFCNGTNFEGRQHEPNAMKSSVEDSEKAFQQHLFQLQALALKLAYENARILIHRPLLSYKAVVHTSIPGGPNGRPQPTDPFQTSISTCRDAALEISRLGSTATFRKAADTYAVSFVSLHLFTAAIALSIMTSLEPLSSESHESKLGIRRLVEMQSLLKTRSIVAEQGLAISKKLISLVLAKEMEKMLQFQGGNEEAEHEPEATERTNRTESTAERNSNRFGRRQSLTQASVTQNFETPSFGADLPSQDQKMLLSPPNSGLVSDFNFDFCEDPTMAQALLDFEEVINYPPEDVFSSTGEILPGSCFGAQDQNWIWGSNYRI